MARKGILPRRKRGRTAIPIPYNMQPTNKTINRNIDIDPSHFLKDGIKNQSMDSEFLEASSDQKGSPSPSHDTSFHFSQLLN